MKGSTSDVNEHCYMFFNPPKEDEVCMQHVHTLSGRRPDELIMNSRNSNLENMLIALLTIESIK